MAIRKSDMVNLYSSDAFEFDYDKFRKQYRISYFRDGHFIDEYWFEINESIFDEGAKEVYYNGPGVPYDGFSVKIITATRECSVTFFEENKEIDSFVMTLENP